MGKAQVYDLFNSEAINSGATASSAIATLDDMPLNHWIFSLYCKCAGAGSKTTVTPYYSHDGVNWIASSAIVSAASPGTTLTTFTMKATRFFKVQGAAGSANVTSLDVSLVGV